MFFDSPASLLNFSSLDFLNLLKHDFVRSTAIDYVFKWGAGIFPSRPLPAYTEEANFVANKLASLLNREAVFLLESYPDLFSCLIHSLVQPNTTILKSKRFSFVPKKKINLIGFDATGTASLENALRRQGHLLILIDSLEAYASGLSNFKALIDLGNARGATIIVDDTFSFGVFGKNSVGLGAGFSDIDLILGNFGKSFGSYASYFACSKHLMNYLLYHNPFLYRFSPLPPLLMGAVDASLYLIPSLHSERRELLAKASLLKPDQTTHFLSLSFSSPEDRKQLQRTLTDHNCLSLASNQQLQFSITQSHQAAEIAQLRDLLKSYPFYDKCQEKGVFASASFGHSMQLSL